MVAKTTKTRTEKRPHAAGAAADDAFFPDRWLLASYLALAVVFFLPALLPGRMLFGSDQLSEAYFFDLFASQRFAAGALPKWVPGVFGGLPFFANAMDTFHPLTLLLHLVRVPVHVHPLLLFVAHYFLAGAGMYLLIRELGARRMPAYLAGLLFMFSGYLLSFIYAGHDGRAMVATLTPLFLFGLHRAVRTGRVRWFMLAGAVLGCANLSNQIQNTYYMLLAGGLWGGFLLWHLDALRPVRRMSSRLGGALLTLAVGFGMAAINYLPFLGYIAASPRGGEGRGYEYATSWSMPPEEILGLAVPERIGLLDAYWGQNPFKLHTEYVGALVILGVVLGVYLLRRSRYLWFFVALALVTLTFALGGHTPIYRLYYELLPGTARFRAPANSFFLLSTALVAIAGLALDRLAALRQERSGVRARGSARKGERTPDGPANTLRIARNLGFGLLAVTFVWGLVAAAGAPDAVPAQPQTEAGMRAAKAAANHPAYVTGVWRFWLFLALASGGLWLWVRGTLSTRVASVLLGLVAVTDLWVIDKKFLDTVPPPNVLYAPDQVAGFLREQPEPFRVFDLSNPRENYLLRFGVDLAAGLHPNPLQIYNEFLGVDEQNYTTFQNIAADFRAGRPTFLSMANVRYLVSPQPVQNAFVEPVFRGRSRQGGELTVLENRQVLPRAFLASAARRVERPEGALERMRSADFDPRREVLLYEDPPLERASGAGDAAPSGSARLVRYEPDEVEIRVQTPEPAYLVVTDTYYDGWRAMVDGDAAPLLQANHAFRAVAVPAGEHVVRFRFDPAALRAGVAVSAIVWLLLAGYGAGLAVRLRRRARSAG